MMAKVNNDTNLFDFKNYNAEIQTIMTTPPRWIIQWGILLIFSILFGIFCVSYFVKYPEIIKTNFVLSSFTPASKILAKESGQIKLLVNDKEMVNKGQLLGYIETTANYEDVEYCLKRDDSIRIYILKHQIESINIKENLNIGELQDAYITFYNLVNEYKTYVRRNDIRKFMVNISKRKDKQILLSQIWNNQSKIFGKQLLLGKQKLERDSLLYRQNVIAKQEFENSLDAYYPLELNIENANQNMKSSEMQLLEIERQKIERNTEENKFLGDLWNNIFFSFNELEKRMMLWREKYLFISPIHGRVTLFNLWSSGQTVSHDQELMNITYVDSKSFGIAAIPIEGSGKVKENQDVIIDFNRYPGNEYGFVKGKVKSISELPIDNSYYAKIELPDILVTDLNKKLEYNEQMKGTANIVTEDLRLIDRFMYGFRKMIKR